MSNLKKGEKSGNTLPVADFEGDDFEAIMDRACERAGLDRIEPTPAADDKIAA